MHILINQVRKELRREESWKHVQIYLFSIPFNTNNLTEEPSGLKIYCQVPQSIYSRSVVEIFKKTNQRKSPGPGGTGGHLF